MLRVQQVRYLWDLDVEEAEELEDTGGLLGQEVVRLSRPPELRRGSNGGNGVRDELSVVEPKDRICY